MNLTPVVVAAIVFATISGCAAADLTSPAPPQLQVPEPSTLTSTLHATGVQIYACIGDKADAMKVSWVFKAPAADLVDETGNVVARHYGGPTWEGTDGSKVVGNLLAKQDSDAPDAIPWLLLKATSSGAAGRFSQVRYVQRLHTRGGKAPSTGCAPTDLGTQARVPYSADYFFFTTG